MFLTPTAVMALTSGGELVRETELGAARGAIQTQIIGGVGANGQRGLLGGNVILAKGDKSGTGPGLGGHKGQKKGGRKGGQHKD